METASTASSDKSDAINDLGSGGLTDHLFAKVKEDHPVSIEGKAPVLGDVRCYLDIYKDAKAADEDWRVKAPKKVISRYNKMFTF